MTVKVGINGFGRIGRQVLKAIRDYYPNNLEVVAFNDIGDLNTMAHLLKYDSNYGRFDGVVEVEGDHLKVTARKSLFSRNPIQQLFHGVILEWQLWWKAQVCSPSKRMESTRRERQ